MWSNRLVSHSRGSGRVGEKFVHIVSLFSLLACMLCLSDKKGGSLYLASNQTLYWNLGPLVAGKPYQISFFIKVIALPPPDVEAEEVESVFHEMVMVTSPSADALVYPVIECRNIQRPRSSQRRRGGGRGEGREGGDVRGDEWYLVVGREERRGGWQGRPSTMVL